MEQCDKIKEIIGGMEEDIEKFEKKSVRAAAPRIRKGFMEIIKLCKAGRQKTQEIKNTF